MEVRGTEGGAGEQRKGYRWMVKEKSVILNQRSLPPGQQRRRCCPVCFISLILLINTLNKRGDDGRKKDPSALVLHNSAVVKHITCGEYNI